MYDVLVFDHRLAEHRPLDSKSELARLLFGYTTGNGQRFPAQPELVRFVSRPGKDIDEQVDLTGRDAITGLDAIAHAEDGEAIRFVYRAEGRRTEGTLARIGTGELRVR
jgi:YD repeat-containing protein